MVSVKEHGRGVSEFPEAEDLSGELRKFVGKKVSYATHGIHRYPAKFIPQIPRYCMDSYSAVGDVVLDPFMGSGTTLLESYIAGRDSCGIDVHPLAKLIAKVKTTPIDPSRLSALAEDLLASIADDAAGVGGWIPEIPNREHWFRPSVLEQLAVIKRNIWNMKSGDCQDFFKVCFSSIIRKVSNSDDDSLIPEVTTFQKKLDQQGKTSYDAIGRFGNAVKNRLMDAADLWNLSREVKGKYRHVPTARIIGRDARDIDLGDGEIDLAITSPPYASAVHYVSVHKLEMYWLGMISETSALDSKLIGTARAYLSEYGDWEPYVSIEELRSVLAELMVRDKKSAFIVFRYFDDMRRSIAEVNRVLKRRARYCLVVGQNRFQKVDIPTYRILARIAMRCGFEIERVLVYDVINRHLDIPRWNDSRIEKDYVLVLRRTRACADSSL